MKFFLTYWAPIISTLAFCLSVYASVMTWRSRHIKPVIKAKWIFKISTQYNLCLSVYNPSSIPTTIQSVRIIVAGGGKYKPIEYPLVLTSVPFRHVLKKSDGIIPIAFFDGPEKKFKSTDMPVNIDPYKAKKIVIPFQFVNDALENLEPLKCDLSVTVNKGKQIDQILDVKQLLISDKEFKQLSQSLTD